MPWWPRQDRPAIAPSILAADFSDLRSELASMATGGADLFHLDVMDAHFVPNLTFGPLIVDAINRATDLPLDVHLMIDHPETYYAAFIEAGADAVTLHIEVESDPRPILAAIREAGIRPGLALNPSTSAATVLPFLDVVDLILIMSVQPGFGGQSFQPAALDKIRFLKDIREDKGLDFEISIDGGITDDIAPEAIRAGADILVSGSWLFNAVDRRSALAKLRNC